MTSFGKSAKLATMQRLQVLQNGQVGSKIKIAKNMPKHSLVTGQSCSVQKKGPETPNFGEMTSFRKTAKILPTMQRLQALQNGYCGSKVKFAKNIRKTSLETRQNCFLQETAPKKKPNIGQMTRLRQRAKKCHNTKAIGFTKWPPQPKN